MAGSRTLKLSILADVDDLKKKLDTGSKEVEGFGGKLGEFGKKAAAAFAVAGAAAAAYAGKLLVEGVKAAIEDEKAQAKLAATLANVTGATDAQIAATEEYIRKTSLAFGVTDDDLRPSLERLTIATGDVTKAQNLQKLALDVAAGSGKSLDTVTQALSKAYEGNTSSLSRLGVGLSAAELKTMSFDEVTATLASTFENQASVQADTLEGRMTRLSVAFDEAKESVGARLLPIITSFLTFVTDKLIPGAESLVAKFKPVTAAIEDNKDEFKALWSFIKDYIVPIVTGALKTGLEGITTVITLAVNTVGKLVSGFQSLYEKFKQFVDFAKNNPLSKFLGNLNPFSQTSFQQTGGVANFIGAMQSSTSNEVAFGSEEFLSIDPSRLATKFGGGQAARNAFNVLQRLKSGAFVSPLLEMQAEDFFRGRGLLGPNGVGSPNVIVNVNAPSVIDEEGFTRSVINALNSSEARTGSLGTLNV